MDPATITALAALASAGAQGASAYFQGQSQNDAVGYQRSQNALMQKRLALLDAQSQKNWQTETDMAAPGQTVNTLNGLAALRKSITQPTGLDVMSYLAG